MNRKLAVNGGDKALENFRSELCEWPIVTDEDRKAINAEGIFCKAELYFPLHLHKVFHEADIFNMGQPTMISFGQRDVRQGPGTLPVSEGIGRKTFSIPRFTSYDEKEIEKVAGAYKKVIDNIGELIQYPYR